MGAPRQGLAPLASRGQSLTLAVCAAPRVPDYSDQDPCTDPQEVVFTCVEWAPLLPCVRPPASCPARSLLAVQEGPQRQPEW